MIEMVLWCLLACFFVGMLIVSVIGLIAVVKHTPYESAFDEFKTHSVSGSIGVRDSKPHRSDLMDESFCQKLKRG